VVFVLERFFALGLDSATEIMLNVHYKGKGVAGVFPRDIATTKAKMVNDFARAQRHPLLCQVEKAN
jgi:ATP-dependent Clp protease adaptor protein ClpS